MTELSLTFNEILNQKVFRGTPILAPQSAVSPKMSTPILPMTPLFIAESVSTLKMGMFTKGLSSIC